MTQESRIFQDISKPLERIPFSREAQGILGDEIRLDLLLLLCVSTDVALMNCFPQVNKYEGTLFSPLLF